ncbi:hypothetical protein [Rhodococcus gannanensis]|uniref:Uncharacterized protein n=1 Tax=Rhodococcus gannanensis TaxID=1960308 RepID=A0ABW4P2P6_9NOCA
MGRKLLRRGAAGIGAAAVVVGVVVGGGVVGAGTANAYCQENPDGGCYNDAGSIDIPDPVREVLVDALTALLPAAEVFDEIVGSASLS